MIRPTAGLLALVMVVAACSASKANDADSVPPTAASSTVAPTAASDGADTTSGASSAATNEPAPSATTGPTAQGVTADTIKLGWATIDIERVESQFGIEVGNVPAGMMDALVAAVNAKGGIGGRQVELVTRSFLPVGDAEPEQACRELIEDEQVFAVMGTFIGDTALCVTETHETPYFGAYGLTPERQARSKAPFLTTGEDTQAGFRNATQLVIDEGVLTGKKVAVVFDSESTEEGVTSAVVEPLRAAGVDVVEVAQLPPGTDAVQSGTSMDLILQKFESSGAEVVLVPMGVGVIIPAVQRSTWRPQFVFMNGQAIGGEAYTKWGATDPHLFDGSLAAVWGNTEQELSVDPLIRQCIDDLDQYGGFDLTPEDMLPTSVNPDSQGVHMIWQGCDIWYFTERILAAAGPNPTSQSILEGLPSLGTFTMVNGRQGTLGPTKWAAGDGSRLWTWDADAFHFVPAGA